MSSSARWLISALLVGQAAFTSSIVAAKCDNASYFRPATLLESKDQQTRVANLTEGLQLPEHERIIQFSGYIGRNGKFRDLCCFNANFDLHRSTIRNLAKRLVNLRFVPAKQGEHLKNVLVNFSILAKKLDNGNESKLLMNHLYSTNKFGDEYIAPQVIVGSVPQRTKQKSRWKPNQFIDSITGRIEVTVDRNGLASNAFVKESANGWKNAVSRMIFYVNKKCFIPGFVNGVAVEMSFVDIFTSQDDSYILSPMIFK